MGTRATATCGGASFSGFVDALQFQVRAIPNESQEKYHDKEEFFTKTNEVMMRVDECTNKIDALREQKSGILVHVREQKVMGEIAALERDKPEFAEYKKKEEGMNGFDPSLSLGDQLTQIPRTDRCSDGGEEG